MRRLRFGLFENAQANDSGTATWRHPDNQRVRFDELAYWRDLARLCEDARLDFLFLADAWGWADVNGERPEICSVEGLDLPRLDPAVVASALMAQTEQLGLVMTGSVLTEQPYAFARRMASLDQLSGGRIGWNVVTTGTAETAVQAFGIPMVPHDERYRMADDFMELVYKLWEGAWEPDALVKDKGGVFADPSKVHRIAHEGPYFRSHGYGNTAYSPQGTPVLFQAGASPAGRAFGGKHGECMFIGAGSVAQLAEHTRAIRAEAVASGRSADAVKIMSAFACVVGKTTADAERKYQRVLDAQSPEVAVASYAWFTGLDLSSYEPDTPMTELHTELSQTQVARFAGLTVGDVLKDWHAHGVGAKPVVGTPEEIADRLCELAEGADLDGFLLSPVIQPGSTQDFVEHVLPILRERGVAGKEYEGATLRERLLGTGSAMLPAEHPAAAHRAGGLRRAA
ncbi:NtaA/DmoA family FMN-dependent monooxygenase [Agromyces soli]|uniref:NtaA/DmoA family FMN-dependent monooxygenase n=1 Tax=Agromyces soli TaxID=659012 RepID=A0ABY4ATX7_9MICO|nr:NtaA/DmoA family FMN-dependent monooxygenase [Agromyces soli]UOE26621.1 NtaA/DmoA family FMN-dependent monooxygenase [Agromyces soli]